MQKIKYKGSYFAYCLLTLVFLLLSAFCFEMPKEKYSKASILYQNQVFYYFQIGAIVLGAILIVVGHLRYEKKPSYLLLAAMIVLFLSNAFALRYERIQGLNLKNHVFVFSAEDKVKFAFAYLLNIEVIYFLFGVLPKITKSRYSLNGLLAAIVISVMFMCIYSFIHEWEVYAYYLQGATGKKAPAAKSLASIRNFWGMALFSGTLAAVVGQARTRKLWWFIPIFTFLFAVFFSFAKTTCTAVLVLLLFFSIYTIIREWKHKKILCIVCIVVTVGMFGLLALCFVPGNIQLVAPFKRFINLMTNSFGAKTTMNGRDLVLGDFFYMMNQQPSAYLFGFGNYSFGFAFSFANRENTSYHTHNAWMEALGRGGLVRLIIFALFTIYFLYVIFYGLIKKKRWWYFVALAGVVSYGLVSAAEFCSPMDSDVWGNLISLSLVVPVLHDHYIEKLGLEDDVQKPSDFKLLPCRLRLEDFLLLGFGGAILLAFGYASVWFVIIGIAVQVALGVLSAVLLKREGAIVALGASLFDTVILLFAHLTGTSTYEVLSSLTLSASICLALLYGFQTAFGTSSYLLDACDKVTAIAEGRTQRFEKKAKGYLFF